MVIIPRRYKLRDGSVYWHKLYFDIVPNWMCKYSPPLGDYNYAAYLYQPWKYFIALYNHGKWFIQRGYRGYADCDVWGLDSYLASWLPEALEQLRRNKCGFPLGLTEAEWDKRLQTMINGFKAAKNVHDFKDILEASKIAYKGLKVFSANFFDLWD